MTESVFDIPVADIGGTETTLADHRGKVLLIVNVASACGLTPQYGPLESLYKTYRDQGFEVLAFPANDFAGQEPGTNDEIKTFCETSFGVSFPLYSKITVRGDDKHPLYRHLTTVRPDAYFKPDSEFKARLAKHGIPAAPAGEVTWNFEKFLVDREGTVVARFAPDIVPDDAVITSFIEANL